MISAVEFFHYLKNMVVAKPRVEMGQGLRAAKNPMEVLRRSSMVYAKSQSGFRYRRFGKSEKW